MQEIIIETNRNFDTIRIRDWSSSSKEDVDQSGNGLQKGKEEDDLGERRLFFHSKESEGSRLQKKQWSKKHKVAGRNSDFRRKYIHGRQSWLADSTSPDRKTSIWKVNQSTVSKSLGLIISRDLGSRTLDYYSRL